MNKEFIPYEEALALKELGFDEPCFGSYVKLTETQNTFFMNDVVSEIDRETPLHESLITKAPLYQQAFRWFREKHNLKYKFEPSRENTVDIFIWEIVGWEYFKTIDEKQAEIVCLRKLIQIIKEICLIF